MSRRILSFLILTIVTLAGSVGMSAGDVKLSVKLDSAYVLMGKATPLHVELQAPASPEGSLIIPEDTLSQAVEVLRMLPADTTELPGDRIQVTREILLQSFDSGTYLLNPVKYVSGSETIASNRLVLKVIPVDVDSLTTIHDYADVVDPSRRLVDYLPDFLADYGVWILALLAVLAIGYFLARRYMRREVITEKKAVVIPPYELAMQELEALKNDHLCEQGHEKEFYTRLTDILRRYLQGRFGINAMEMTTTQIRSILAQSEETRLTRRNMEQVLETADFVKFAKVRPLPDDNTRSFRSAQQFVEDTRPRPQTTEEPDTTDSPTDSPTDSNNSTKATKD
ncbi:MAG: cell wall anchor protein [Bacteroides sp.]|nr:cell wall anchor protein [Bacteroides sp.]